MRPPLRLKLLPVALCLASASPTWARSQGPVITQNTAITLNATREWATEPLTTEKIATLDPDARNPHRRRWLVSRHLELRGVEPTLRGKGSYGAHASVLDSLTRVWVRGAGPWYRPLTEFPCAALPASGDPTDTRVRAHGYDPEAFADEAGVKEGASAAAKLWEEIVEKRKPQLELLLAHVAAPTAEGALARARASFEIWKEKAENDWLAQAGELARRASWHAYAREARAAGSCRGAAAKAATAAAKAAAADADGADDAETAPTPAAPVSRPWSSMMEPLPATNGARLLARAPARRWEGLFSIRLDVIIGARRLNGQFLVDSGARQSLISPSWLDSQGIPKSYVEHREIPPRHLSWTHGSGLVRTAQVDHVEIAGYPIALKDFLLFETNDLYSPPAFQASCCDGVLGADFLQRQVVEFLPGIPPAVRLWSIEGYRYPEADSRWAEAGYDDALGEPVSRECVAVPEHPRSTRAESQHLPGTRWDTGDEVPLDIHRPWQKKVSEAGKLWVLQCENAQTVASEVPATFPRLYEGADRSLFSSTNPATTSGMGILGRGPFAFDLPHGRIWFSKQNLNAPLRQDHSGLKLEYIEDEQGDRRLRVVSLQPGTPAEALANAGLKPGQLINQIDGKPAEDLDLWEIHQRLAGEYDDTVSLRWNVGDKAKIAPIKVR